MSNFFSRVIHYSDPRTVFQAQQQIIRPVVRAQERIIKFKVRAHEQFLPGNIKQTVKDLGRATAPITAKISPYVTAVAAFIANFIPYVGPLVSQLVVAAGYGIGRYEGATGARAEGLHGEEARRKGRGVGRRNLIYGEYGALAGLGTTLAVGEGAFYVAEGADAAVAAGEGGGAAAAGETGAAVATVDYTSVAAAVPYEGASAAETGATVGGEFVTEADLVDTVAFTGPVQEGGGVPGAVVNLGSQTAQPIPGIVTAGNYGAQPATDVYGIVTPATLGAQPSEAVPGIVTTLGAPGSGGPTFAQIVSGVGSVLSAAQKFLPAKTASGLQQIIPNLFGGTSVGAPAGDSSGGGGGLGTGAGRLLLYGTIAAALLGGFALYHSRRK